jgi:hypothetical protein
MIGQLTTAKKIHLDTHKIEYYVASPLWSTYVGYKMENFETQKIHDEVWCYWEQLVEYMRIWGTNTHTHTHTHTTHTQSIILRNLFGNTKTQKKESSAGKGS